MPASVTCDGRGSDPAWGSDHAWMGLRKADKQVAALFCVLTFTPFASGGVAHKHESHTTSLE